MTEENLEQEKKQVLSSTGIVDSSSQKDLYIVGIGASAGGYEAIEKFFSNMPPVSGMAFVVVQHLSPDFKSLMVELLSKHTEMKVMRVEDGVEVQPNCVYLIPPKKILNIFENKLFLTELRYSHGLNLPINIFFRSLAEQKQERAIGIIFSGTGTDGTLGIRDIKGVGGLTLVQDVQSSKFDGMPKSAIATGMVDYILAPERIPEVLLQYVQHRSMPRKEAEEFLIGKNIDNITRILMFIKKQENIDFTYYKPSTIFRRVEKRMGINSLNTIEEYVHFSENNRSEIKILANELLIGVTKFFREPEAFDTIQDSVIPEILAGKKQGDSVRVWVVACSTGEEAYFMAILFREYMESANVLFDVKIFATDVDKAAVEQASIGIYPDSILADVGRERLQKFFVKKDSYYQIEDSIRKMIIFASQDVIKDPPFNNIDLISCRNLLIYFQPKTQKKVLSGFHFALQRNGFLLLGKSETVGDMMNHYKTVDSRMKIYRKVGTSILERSDIQEAGRFQGNLPKFVSARGRRDDSDERHYDLLYKQVMTHYEPIAMIVNERNDPEFFLGEVDQFLLFSKGKVNLNISKIVHEDLSVAIGTAIHKCRKEKKEIRYTDITVRKKSELIVVDLVVRPISIKGDVTNYVLIELIPVKKIEDTAILSEVYSVDQKVDQRLKDLELDLQLTRENLQATVEELETSNEELQATNEELLASNEELQSTNEELQSVNEELITVNSEYQNKIQELENLNNDYDNLLNSTDIGTLFLDRELRIRKFTPALKEQFHLLDIDIGRPIFHFSHNMHYPEFFDDLNQTLIVGKPVNREVESLSGKWFMVRILQYKTSDNYIEGVVITMLDISQRREMRNEIQALTLAAEHIQDMVMVTDVSGQISYVNKSFSEISGYALADIRGRDAAMLSPSQKIWDYSSEIKPMLDEGKKWQGDLLIRGKNGQSYTEKATIIGLRSEANQI